MPENTDFHLDIGWQLEAGDWYITLLIWNDSNEMYITSMGLDVLLNNPSQTMMNLQWSRLMPPGEGSIVVVDYNALITYQEGDFAYFRDEGLIKVYQGDDWSEISDYIASVLNNWQPFFPTQNTDKPLAVSLISSGGLSRPFVVTTDAENHVSGSLYHTDDDGFSITDMADYDDGVLLSYRIDYPKVDYGQSVASSIFLLPVDIDRGLNTDRILVFVSQQSGLEYIYDTRYNGSAFISDEMEVSDDFVYELSMQPVISYVGEDKPLKLLVASGDRVMIYDYDMAEGSLDDEQIVAFAGERIEALIPFGALFIVVSSTDETYFVSSINGEIFASISLNGSNSDQLSFDYDRRTMKIGSDAISDVALPLWLINFKQI